MVLLGLNETARIVVIRIRTDAVAVAVKMLVGVDVHEWRLGSVNIPVAVFVKTSKRWDVNIALGAVRVDADRLGRGAKLPRACIWALAVGGVAIPVAVAIEPLRWVVGQCVGAVVHRPVLIGVGVAVKVTVGATVAVEC